MAQRQQMMYEKAPDLLIEKIAELESIVTKHKIKNPGNDGVAFYEDIVQVMKFSFNYMLESRQIFVKNLSLETINRVLMEENQRLQKRVDEIDAMVRMELEGRLDEEVEKTKQFVKDFIASRNTIKQQ
jgi:hypothetical protein